MTAWEVIDATGDEETKQVVNDGSLTSLYEIVKLAYLEPAEDLILKTVPKIQSSISYGLASISIDSSVFIFGEGCSSFHLNLTLVCTIDVMVWLPGGKFLLLADNSGTLHCLHIESKQVVFTKKLPVNKASRSSLFIEGKCFTLVDGTSSVIFITSNGKIIRLDAIESESMEEGLKMKDIPFLNSLHSKISLSIYLAIEDAEVLCGDCLMFGSSSLCVWMATKGGIYTWMSEWIYTLHPVSYQIAAVSSCTKLTQLMNGRYLVVLNEFKCLSVLCGHSGIVVWDGVSDNRLEGMVLSVQCLFSDTSTAQLLLLLQKHEEGEDSSFCILNIPSLECSHMVSVNQKALPCTLGDGADSIIYLEPEFTFDCAEACLSRIKLKSVVDGVPETRLAKLLKMYKFNEAEEFCGNFHLDVNEVLKAKARFLCDLMNPWQGLSANTTMVDHVATSGNFDELLLTLGRIDDNEFVTTLCINVPLSDVGATRQLLSYAKDRLANSLQSGDCDHLSFLMQKVSKNLYRLCTFLSIFPSDVYHWLSFSRVVMLEEFLQHLKKGNLEIAATIWHRHQFEFMSEVDEECVSHILRLIPFNVPSSTLSSWLPKHLLRDFIKLCPSAIEIIAKWTDKRIRLLEIIEKDQWPSNGLGLATATIDAIETIAADFCTEGDMEVQLAVHMAQWKAHSPSSYLCQLRHTALALTDLHLLTKKFFIKVELSEYIQEDKGAVVTALLDWLVSGEEVEPFVKEFLSAFLLRHNLQLDQMLEQYVVDCLASSDCDWWLYQEAPWEDKIYSVISVISDAQIKAKCIVESVRMAPVPWSKGTHDMCSRGMSLNTPFTRNLQEQERLSRLKIVLRRYNLHLIKYEDGRNGQFILRSIVSHDGENVMEDALTVISVFISVQVVDAYYYRILHLLKTKNYAEVKRLLLELGEEQRYSTCKRLIQYVSQQLNLRPVNKKCQESLQSLTSGIIALQFILEKNMKIRFSQYEGIMMQIRRINALQEKYNLYPSRDDLDSEECCLGLLKAFVIDLYVQSKKASAKPSPPNPNLTRSAVTTLRSVPRTVIGGSSSSFVPPGKDPKTFNLTSNSLAEEEREWVEDNMGKHINRVEYLSSLLGVPSSHLALLASHASEQGQIDIALQFTRQLTSKIDLVSAHQYIFKLIELTASQCQDESKTLGCHKGNVCQQKRDFMILISSILSSAMLVCHPGDIATLNEFGFWYHIGKYLYEQCHFKDISTNENGSSNNFWHWKFSPIFIDSSVPIDEPIVSRTLSKIINNALQIHRSKTSAVVSVVKSDTDSGKDHQKGDAASSVEQLCNHLKERSQDLFAFIISQNVRTDMDSNALSNLTVYPAFSKGFTSKRVLTLLMKIVNSKQRDNSFACSLLTHLTIKESLKVLTDIIKKLGYDFSRLLLVGEIGNDFFSINQLKKIGSQFSMLVMKANWGKLFEKFGISFKGGFSGDEKALQVILKELASHVDCTFAILNDFCRDFSLDMTQVLSYYLRVTIRTWKPQTKNENDPLNSCLFQEVPRSCVRKINAIISKMQEKREAKRVLEEEFMEMSSYNYEMLDVVMFILGTFEDDDDPMDIERGKNILCFLRSYQRCCEPGKLEKDAWQSADSEMRPLPPIAQSRLPFHELHHKDKTVMKEIMERELNRNTVDKWIAIACTLKVNPDQLYFLATQNTVSEALEKQENQQTWQICSTNGSFLLHVQTMISRIKHRNLSTACANWVVNRMPSGEDKVNAAKKCFQLVGRCMEHEQNPDSQINLSEMYQKFKTRYHRLAIEHTLHKYGLAQPEYLCLIRDPEALVFRLYEHPSLSCLVTLNARHMIDINGCVTQICNIMDFSQTSIQMELLLKWLPMTACSPDDTEETVSNFILKLDQDAPNEKSNFSSDNSLSRIIFLARCCPQDQVVSYLLNQALSTSDLVGTSVRLKALRCLLAIANQETIQKQSNVSMKEIGILLQTLTYVYRLEELGHTTTPSSFASMDKDALVEGIWRAQRHSPEALLLLVDICHDFKILTASLWEALLAQLTSFVKTGKVDVKLLEKVLMRVRNIPHLWLLPQVTAAWTLVIYSPFKKAHVPVSEKNLRECVHAVNLFLQSCPVDILTEGLLDLCTTLDLPILALTLQYKMQTKACKVEDLLREYSPSKLNLQYEQIKAQISFPQNIEDLLSTLK